MARGEFITDAAEEAGTYRKKGARWLARDVRPRRGRDLQGRCLTFAEREDIALGRAVGESMRAIAARLGRSPSAISRELGRTPTAASATTRRRRTHWPTSARGEFITVAAEEAGTYRKKGARWLRDADGVRPRRGRDLQGSCLTFAEREDIALGRAVGESMRAIADRLGRSPSTISRELGRNTDRGERYHATTAHALAYERASRPKPAKLASNVALRRKVEQDLQRHYSPEQIAGRLRREFPDDLEMRCRPRRSINRCTCNRGVRCAATSRAACARAERCGARAASPASARTASRT
jgi:transposase